MLNAAQFSAAKSASEAKELQKAIFTESGAIKPYIEFQKDAMSIAEIHQQTWLRVERDMCVRQCVQSEAFRRLEEDKDLYPYWVYSGTLDDRERDEHLALEGLAFRIGDPAGDACFPPNGWNCRCKAEPSDNENLKIITGEEARKYLDENVNEQFRYNPATQGMMPKTGNYFKSLPSANDGDEELFDL